MRSTNAREFRDSSDAWMTAPEWRVYELQQQLRDRSPRLDRIDDPAAHPEPPRKFKWATAVDNVYRFNPATAVALQRLWPVDWAEMRGLDKSESGAEGVFFTEMPGGVVVLKASRSIASEAFASLLMSFFDVYTPPLRIIKVDAEEGHALLRAAQKTDPTWRATATLFDMIAQQQAYLLMQGYIGHGRSLADIHDVSPAVYLQSKTLRQLGALLAVDVLVNNADRLPCPLWDNPGNPSNVLLCDGEVIAIDSQVSAIDTDAHPEQFQKYQDAVRDMLVHIMSASASQVSAPFLRLQGLLFAVSGTDVGDDGLTAIHDGFCAVVRACASRRDELVAAIALWRDTLAEFTPPLVQLHAVNLAFIGAVVDLFAEAGRPSLAAAPGAVPTSA